MAGATAQQPAVSRFGMLVEQEVSVGGVAVVADPVFGEGCPFQGWEAVL